MPFELEPIQANYTAGELDPDLTAREDSDLFYTGAEYMRNVILHPHGGYRRRPGLVYRCSLVPVIEAIDLTDGAFTITAPNGGTVADAIDGDLTTKMTTTTNLSTVDPYVVIHADLGAAWNTPIRFADVRDLSLDGATFINIEDEFRVQFSDDNVAWTDVEIPYPFITEEDERWYYRRSVPCPDLGAPTPHRYWRVVREGSTDGGTRKVELAEFVLYKDKVPAELSAARIVEFEAAALQTYALVLTGQNCRIFKNGIRQADVWIPHTSDQVQQASWTQSLDTLLIFHEDVQPHTVFRLGEDTKWNSRPQIFTSINTRDFGDIQGAGGGAEDVWSATRGWPRCGAFFKSRLYLAGTRDLASTVWASAIDDQFAFLVPGTPQVDDPFEVSIDTDAAASIYHLESADFLFYITSSGPFAQFPRDEPPTGENVAIVRVRGKKRARGPGFRAWQLDKAIVFLDDSGSQLNEVVEEVFRGSFEVNNLAFLAPHLVRNPQDIALRRSISADRGDLMLLVNNDGSLAVLQTLRDRSFSGWSGWHTASADPLEVQGTFIAVGTQVGGTDGRYFAVVQRLIDGALIRTFEEFDENALLDSSVIELATSETIRAISDKQDSFVYSFTSPAKQGETPTIALTTLDDGELQKFYDWDAPTNPVNVGIFNNPLGELSSATLIVAVATEDTPTNPITGVTYAGESMTKIDSAVEGLNEVSLWRLDDPPVAGDIIVTFTGDVSRGGVSAMVVQNVDVGVPIAADKNTEVNQASSTVTTSPGGLPALAINVMSTAEGVAATPSGTGHTELVDIEIDANMRMLTGYTERDVLGAINQTWTRDGGGTYSRIAHCAALLTSLPPSDVSDLTVRKNLVLLENGLDYFVDLATNTITLSAAQAAEIVEGDEIRVAIKIVTVSGLGHLEGQTVRTRIDHAVGSEVEVSGGQITVPDFADDQVQVGLGFPDVKEILVEELQNRDRNPFTEEEARFKIYADSDGQGIGEGLLVRDMPAAVPPGGAEIQMRGRKKRVHTAVISVESTQGFNFGANDEPPEPIEFQQVGDFFLDRRPPYRSETFRRHNLQGWTFDGQTEVTQTEDVPLTVKSVVRRIAVSRG